MSDDNPKPATELPKAEPSQPDDATTLKAEATPKPESGGPADKAASPPQPQMAKGESIKVHDKQKASRAENQDFMRVLNMFGGAIPSVYIANVNASDMLVGNRVGPTADVTPPPNRDTAQVSRVEIKKINQVYQLHVAFPAALRLLKENRCIALKGRPGVGKWAAAIKLSVSLRGESASLWELSREENLLTQVESLTLRSGTVYIVDDLLRERARAVDRRAMSRIVEALEKNDCHLIVCVKPDAPLPPELRSAALEPLPADSIPVALEKHLEYYGPSLPAEQIQSVLAHEQVAKLVQAGLAPAQADQLAQLLAGTLVEEKPIDDALRGFVAVAEEDVRRWFDETADSVEDSAFKIALAVFSGARYVAVDEAARHLSGVLKPEPETKSKGEPKSLPVSPFKKDTRERKLAKARAKLVRRTVSTEYSDNAQIEVVELEDPAYSAAMLKYLWTEFDEVRQSFLDWLCAYAIYGPSDVKSPQDMRLRAAGAIGALATLEFEYIRARVFRKWAFEGENSDERREFRQALGNALGVLIWNPERSEDVLGLLRAWVEDGREALRWAAARAYAQVGLKYPREAINQWRTILEEAGKITFHIDDELSISIPHPLQMSVVDAIVSLFLRALEFPHRLRPVYEEALEGLAAWVEADAKDKVGQAGLPLFLALTVIQMPPDDGSGNPEDWPPAMLYIVGTQPDSTYRRALASMLRSALNHPHYDEWAIQALKYWAEYAEKNKWVEEKCTDLLRELLALPHVTERERGRLSVHLRRWATRPKNPMECAARMLHVLKLND